MPQKKICKEVRRHRAELWEVQKCIKGARESWLHKLAKDRLRAEGIKDWEKKLKHMKCLA